MNRYIKRCWCSKKSRKKIWLECIQERVGREDQRSQNDCPGSHPHQQSLKDFLSLGGRRKLLSVRRPWMWLHWKTSALSSDFSVPSPTKAQDPTVNNVSCFPLILQPLITCTQLLPSSNQIPLSHLFHNSWPFCVCWLILCLTIRNCFTLRLSRLKCYLLHLSVFSD